MEPKSKDFENLLLSSIDEALLSLGESSRKSIYFHLEKKYNISRNSIPKDLPQFQESLEKIFGIGATFIEILIMKNLYLKIGHPLAMQKNERLEFIKYVNAARQSFMKGSRENC